MAKAKKIWIASHALGGDENGSLFIGIFDTKKKAKQACSKQHDYIAAWQMNLADLDDKVTDFDEGYWWPFRKEDEF